MSIISLADEKYDSHLNQDHVEKLCERLGVKINNKQDVSDYLTLLQSFEAVMDKVDRGPDFMHPALEPVAVSGERRFWKPAIEENPFNAWSHRCSLKAENPETQLLQGCTVAIKDNISVGGVPTTLGTFPTVVSRDGIYPPSEIDATVVSRILRAGAEISGTSSCESFCASPLSFTSATGPVHNPRLHGYTAGGSSSGSSVLVAAHFLAHSSNNNYGTTAQLGVGTDQAGSVRIPASYNGIYGLKPTFGLVPYTGTASMSPMIDHLGPLASNLEHIATLLHVMAGYDGIDPRMTPESPQIHQVKNYPQILAEYREVLNHSPCPPPLRVGLLTESFSVPGISPQVRTTVREAAYSFFRAAGAAVVDISVPMHSEGPVIWTASTRPSMYDWLCKGQSSGYLNYLAPHIEIQWPPTQQVLDLLSSTNPAVVNIILSGLFNETQYKPGVEAKAHRKVFELRAAYDRALEDVDVLITPCAPTIAMPHPQLINVGGEETTILERLSPAIGLTSNTCPFNVTGHPAMNVPCGSSSHPEHPDVQLPIGMQIVGRRWHDEQVITAAAHFEKGREVRSK